MPPVRNRERPIPATRTRCHDAPLGRAPPLADARARKNTCGRQCRPAALEWDGGSLESDGLMLRPASRAGQTVSTSWQEVPYRKARRTCCRLAPRRVPECGSRARLGPHRAQLMLSETTMRSGRPRPGRRASLKEGGWPQPSGAVTCSLSGPLGRAGTSAPAGLVLRRKLDPWGARDHVVEPESGQAEVWPGRRATGAEGACFAPKECSAPACYSMQGLTTLQPTDQPTDGRRS
jgi:hypothetical protein